MRNTFKSLTAALAVATGLMAIPIASANARPAKIIVLEDGRYHRDNWRHRHGYHRDRDDYFSERRRDRDDYFSERRERQLDRIRHERLRHGLRNNGLVIRID